MRFTTTAHDLLAEKIRRDAVRYAYPPSQHQHQHQQPAASSPAKPQSPLAFFAQPMSRVKTRGMRNMCAHPSLSFSDGRNVIGRQSCHHPNLSITALPSRNMTGDRSHFLRAAAAAPLTRRTPALCSTPPQTAHTGGDLVAAFAPQNHDGAAKGSIRQILARVNLTHWPAKKARRWLYGALYNCSASSQWQTRDAGTRDV